MTQEEIRNWGRQRKVHLTFYEFTNSIITFRLQAPPVPPIMTADYQGNPVNWRGLFQPIMQRLDDDARLDLSGATGEVEMEFDAPIFINGERAAKTSLSCRIRRMTREVLLSSVVAYDDASAGGQPPKAIVGSLDLGTSEIVEAADAVTLVVDRQISIPASCLFHKIGYDFGESSNFVEHNSLDCQMQCDFKAQSTFNSKGVGTRLERGADRRFWTSLLPSLQRQANCEFGLKKQSPGQVGHSLTNLRDSLHGHETGSNILIILSIWMGLANSSSPAAFS